LLKDFLKEKGFQTSQTGEYPFSQIEERQIECGCGFVSYTINGERFCLVFNQRVTYEIS